MSKVSNKAKIIAITVTYGNRWHLLSQVLQHLIDSPEVDLIILVNNAVTYDLNAALKSLPTESTNFIHCISLLDNLGSAGGFAEGIKAAYNQGADFIYLLDDDNAPEEGAIAALLSAYKDLSEKNPLLGLLSHRPTSAPYFQKLVEGLDPRTVYGKRNNFIGFSVLHILRNRQYKRQFQNSEKKNLDKVPLGYAPWGGFFFSRHVVDVIGFPNADYYLYAEDFDYSFRIPQKGGQLWLISASKVTDLETSWTLQTPKKRLIDLPILEDNGFRAYYATRNQVYFNYYFAVSNKFLFWLNGFIYSTFFLFLALTERKTWLIPIYFRAVLDGYHKNLGRNFAIESRVLKLLPTKDHTK